MKYLTLDPYHKNDIQSNNANLSDKIWELYINLEDNVSDSLIEAIIFFMEHYDFDIDELPPKVYKAVTSKLKVLMMERYVDDKISDMMESGRGIDYES